MIVAEQKPIKQIYEIIKPHKKVLILGCGTCVTVCSAGGEKEVATLASALAIMSKELGKKREFLQQTIERQCDREFIEPILPIVNSCDAVLSLACGAGVQLVSDMTTVPVVPGLNTNFMGITQEQGVWTENCRGCGDCVLHLTAGICPVSKMFKESDKRTLRRLQQRRKMRGRPRDRLRLDSYLQPPQRARKTGRFAKNNGAEKLEFGFCRQTKKNN